MTVFAGNAVIFKAIDPVYTEGKPVIFSAPRVWVMQATASGLKHVRLGQAHADGSVEMVTPAP